MPTTIIGSNITLLFTVILVRKFNEIIPVWGAIMSKPKFFNGRPSSHQALPLILTHFAELLEFSAMREACIRSPFAILSGHCRG